jgi:hypothetical protein
MNSNVRLSLGWLLLAISCTPLLAQSAAPTHEPRNEKEAALQNKYADQIQPETYQKWVAHIKSREPEEQAWLRTLEDQLGNFYFPAYLKELFNPEFNPENDAWAYVKDDPKLPRVLIIGDSISRAYTADARKALKGKANVHRAPANCGPTQNFIKNCEIWLNQNGSNKWDFIVVNFGIHDSRQPATYEDNLRKVIARLKQTGASIFWVRTTPWGKDSTVFEKGGAGDASLITNPTSDQLAKAEDLEIIDAHAVMAPLVEGHLNRKDFTHWDSEAYRILGNAVADALTPRLKTLP